ncbi:MAG: UDP-4-amino-4,6-dideoxy-N-acetyl-beta-L-altrosamine transaminase [Lachnospiraceae bacterium]|jgi:UDP-4-amino-4,6-dideoxy-N-acetyl-beta-L-altrosamine transaminase|nr:UDP-4-amino-4,6-dideoxy-N-acetyl-beta-L-altrosamine transaminase [Lachnospiraceae bacterium]
MEKPAICGGSPACDTPIQYGRQYIDDADIRAVSDVLRSDFLTCGPQIPALEEKFCKVTGAKYAVAVSNGTAALHIACIAAGIGPGDEVITTPITFAASANCVSYCGGTPVFADIDPETYNMDPAAMEACITPKTKAVIPVHYTGQAVAYDEIAAICQKHGLLLIQDAAHAIGTLYKGQPIGSLADMTCFSSHPVKTVTSGEGGVVTTNDEVLYQKLLLARSHGITRDHSQMSEPCDDPWYYEMISLGYNYRLTEIQAALFSSQLDKLPVFSKRRKEIVKRYNEAFRDVEGIIVQKEIPSSDTTRHLYMIQLDPDILTCSRRQFFDAMTAENIHCQVHYIPVYRLPYYQRLGYPKGLCPKAERLYERILSIPLYYSLTDRQVEDVILAVRKICAYYHK